jgi:hypothetical protein
MRWCAPPAVVIEVHSPAYRNHRVEIFRESRREYSESRRSQAIIVV